MNVARTRRAADSIDIIAFFFNDTATTEIYTLSLHDALPIFSLRLADPNQTSIVPGKEPTLPVGSFAKARTRRSDPTLLPGRHPKTRTPKLKVLVVDDVNDVTEMIGLFLKHAGYEVSTADSARAALRLAGERAFDLIISDIGMPAMK